MCSGGPKTGRHALQGMCVSLCVCVTAGREGFSEKGAFKVSLARYVGVYQVRNRRGRSRKERQISHEDIKAFGEQVTRFLCMCMAESWGSTEE